MLLHLHIPEFSRVGQFAIDPRALEKKAKSIGFHQTGRMAEEVRERRKGPRHDDIEGSARHFGSVQGFDPALGYLRARIRQAADFAEEQIGRAHV